MFYITHQSVSHDEPFTIYHAQFDLLDMINYLKQYNNPPLYEIIMHFWIKLFGISTLSVRILPMLFSSFVVLFIYKIGRDFFNERVALLSTVLYTFSSMQIWYAHDCRVYSLFLLLTVISFYIFFKFLKEEKLSAFQNFIFILVNVLILYAHYFGAFVILLESMIILFYYLKKRQMFVKYIKSMTFVGIGYLPQIIVLYQRFSVSVKTGTWLKPPSGMESIYNMIWSFTNAPVVAVLSIAILIISLTVFIVKKKNTQNPFVKYLVLWFFFPFVFMFFVSYKVPMFLDRYLIFITPAFYLLLALGISFLFSNKRIYYVAACILMGSFIFSSSFNPDKKRLVKDSVEFIKSKKDNKTIVLVCSPEFMTNFVYYYNQSYFKAIGNTEYGKTEELMKTENVYFIDRLYPDMISKLNNFNTIIYFDAGADFSSPDNKIKENLSSVYKLNEEKFFYELFNVYIYSKK